jgi:AcrR family transcriptional regulator
MEAIAAAADISPNTIYNYYRTKGQLLIALIAASDDSFFAGLPAVSSRADGAIDWMVEFLEALAAHSLAEIDRNTWKHAIAQTMAHEGSEDIGKDIRAINRRLETFIERELKALKGLGRLPAETRPGPLASMLFDLHRIIFIRAVTSEDMPWRSHRLLLRRYVEAALGPKTASNGIAQPNAPASS